MKNNLSIKIFLCFLFFLAVLVRPIGAQELADKKVSFSYYDEPLDLVFLDLELKYRLSFEFNQDEVKLIRISCDYPRMPLEEALQMMLTPHGFSFLIKNTGVILIFSSDQQPGDFLTPSNDAPSRFNFTFSGQARDAFSGESLPFATLLIRDLGKGTNTNVDGWFSLFDVPSDTVLIEISYIGYQTAYHRLKPGEKVTDVEIRLKPIGQVLEEVTVLASREEQMMKASTGISQIAISPAQITAIPSLGEKDIFRSLQLLPGVSGSNESSSGLYVRGGTPDQNLVLFDGFTVYHVDHLFGFFSAFNSNAIKDVQLFKGGFAAEYGGRLSSVVDITGKDGNSETLNVGGGISLLSANAFAEAPFAKGKGTILLAGRRSFQSNFYNNLLELSDGDEVTGTEEETETEEPTSPFGGRRGMASVEPNSWFYDLNAKATYRMGSNIFSLSFYNGKDELDNSRYSDENSFGGGPFGGGGTPDFNFTMDIIDQSNWGNTGTSLKWSRRWNDQLYSNALLSSSNYFSYRDRGVFTVVERDTTTTEINAGTTEDNNLNDLSFKWDWEWQPKPQHQLGFGVFTSRFDIQYDYVQNDTITVLARDDQGLLSGMYLQSKSTFGDKLIVFPGVRLSYFGPTSKLYVEPRFQVQYLATDRIKIKAATGRYFQFANRVIREDISQGSRDFWVLADGKSVPAGASDHLIFGLAYETDNYLFDVEGYVKDLTNITEYSTRFVINGFGRNSSLDFEENFYNGTGVAKGIELLAQRKSGALTGWVSYTLGEVEHQFDIYGETPFSASHDVTHELKIVGVYRTGNWSLGGTFIYATGRPYTAPLGAYTVELLDGNTTDHFAVSNKNALRLPDYHRLDLSVNYDFERLFGGQATVGFSLFNVYGRKNIWYKEFEVVDGIILETDVNLLGTTPSLFFNWQLH